MRRLIFFSISIIFLYGCGPSSSDTKNSTMEHGIWRGVLKLQDIEVPFTLHIKEKGESFELELQNAEERIPLEDVIADNDSIHIPMYIFDATIHAKIENSKRLTGVWIKNYAKDYIVPFEANYGIETRFLNTNDASASFNGKWEVDFITEEKVRKAIGVFNQQGNKITGTFLLAVHC